MCEVSCVTDEETIYMQDVTLVSSALLGVIRHAQPPLLHTQSRPIHSLSSLAQESSDQLTQEREQASE